MGLGTEDRRPVIIQRTNMEAHLWTQLHSTPHRYTMPPLPTGARSSYAQYTTRLTGNLVDYGNGRQSIVPMLSLRGVIGAYAVPQRTSQYANQH